MQQYHIISMETIWLVAEMMIVLVVVVAMRPLPLVRKRDAQGETDGWKSQPHGLSTHHSEPNQLPSPDPNVKRTLFYIASLVGHPRPSLLPASSSKPPSPNVDNGAESLRDPPAKASAFPLRSELRRVLLALTGAVTTAP